MKPHITITLVTLFTVVTSSLVAESAWKGFKRIRKQAKDAVQDVANGADNVRQQVGNGMSNIWRETWNAPEDVDDLDKIWAKMEREGRKGIGNLREEANRWGAKWSDEALAKWIEESRAEALRAGTHPIPEEILNVMVEFGFPKSGIENVRYRVGRGTVWALPSFAINYGEARAITLGEVIVFDGLESLHDDVLWAHELEHVMQYNRYGFKRFAYHYLEDRTRMEGMAERVAMRYADFMGYRW
jgi:hypothetical protein